MSISGRRLPRGHAELPRGRLETAERPGSIVPVDQPVGDRLGFPCIAATHSSGYGRTRRVTFNLLPGNGCPAHSCSYGASYALIAVSLIREVSSGHRRCPMPTMFCASCRPLCKRHVTGRSIQGTASVVGSSRFAPRRGRRETARPRLPEAAGCFPHTVGNIGYIDRARTPRASRGSILIPPADIRNRDGIRRGRPPGAGIRASDAPARGGCSEGERTPTGQGRRRSQDHESPTGNSGPGHGPLISRMRRQAGAACREARIPAKSRAAA